ncbi:MAG: Cas10/Cmr2 second palm domain-containing protein [Ktedonobacteraceae bacterium]
MGKVLIAFDTNHIKGYVFGTDTLKEIRGASSRLDRLNRDVMKDLAVKANIHVDPIYTNGGAGLFLVDSYEQADSFGKLVQKEYRKVTGGGSSITYVIQPLPKDAPDDVPMLLELSMRDTLALMRYRLREQKDCPASTTTHPSHPFMYLCDSCGVEYAGKIVPDQGEKLLLCESCRNKRVEEKDVRDGIKESISYHVVEKRSGKSPAYSTSPLWDEVIDNLSHLNYHMTGGTERPQDFNVFSLFKGTRDYMALIYADGNNMGQIIEKIPTLGGLQVFAKEVDSGVKWAVSNAIAEYLQVERHMKLGTVLPEGQGESVFPFDILLLGGDDVVMVTPASVAFDVALTIADKFHEYTGYTLSVGVVLAPVKYPFGLLLDLAETTLKFAKDEGAKRRFKAKEKGQPYTEMGMINFMTVLGSTSRNFKKVYGFLKSTKEEKKRTEQDFYATLRPYDTKQLTALLNMIRKGHRENLGRTKLYQLREAILGMNLTSAQSDARALWNNWKPKQRDFVIDCLYEFANQYQGQAFQADDPSSLSYERPFPWFADGKDGHARKVYRTSLLDFVELYDFVTREEADGGDED